jgi:pimeloyl-ACP methyl ester carboxylesterase
VTANYEHIPPGLAAHLIQGAAGCEGLPALLRYADEHDWNVEAERITCPVRIIWGTEDRILPWPEAAADLQAELPQADWVVLDGVGHCPQLDVPLEAAELILGFIRD